MKSNKKGQGAMEYLMTYGWAIIVVMIVGLALWNLGILNIGKTYPKGFSGFSAVRPLDWCVDVRATPSYNVPDGTSITPFTMTILNAEGTNVKIQKVEATGQCTTSPDGIVGGEYTLTFQPVIEPNNVYVVWVSNEDPLGLPPDTHHIDCTRVALGEPYKFQLLITYNKTIDKNLAMIHKTVGNIWGTFESSCLVT